MKIRADRVSVAGDDEGCQVIFDDGDDDGRGYVILQRHFEGSGGDLLYVETHDPNNSGHHRVRRARLGRDRFRLELLRRDAADVDVVFRATTQEYDELARVLRTMIPCLEVACSEDTR